MKAEAVRIVEERSGFGIYHWRKFKTYRTTRDEAEAFAEELRRTLQRRRFERQEKQRQRGRELNGEAWGRLTEEEKRRHILANNGDPNAPERGFVTTYHADGHTTKGWFWIPPDHPFHWAQRFRRPLRVVDGTGSGEHIIPAELPPLAYQERALRPVREEDPASRMTMQIL